MSNENLSETSYIYKEGDIVWVKLGSTWWPGVVNDSEKLPPEVEFKKPPLAVVKFFDEDTYEYVKSWGNICPYNCDRKVEYIKKGMAAFRKNVPHMQKFPKDVSNAEVLIGGNPNILSEPIFIEKKRYYSDDESPTLKGKSPKLQKEKKMRPKNVKKQSHITHRRFLGFNDYKAYICIQSPEKDRIPGDKEDEEVILLNTEPEQLYRCYCCCFTSKRLEVMIIHMKLHVSGTSLNFKKKRPLISKGRKEKNKKPRSSINKDIYQNSRKKEDTTSKIGDGNLLKEIQTPMDKTENEEKPKTASDIRSHLLAEWDDSDDEMDDTFNTQSSSVIEITDSSILDENCDKKSESTFQSENDTKIDHNEYLSISLMDTTDLNNLSDTSLEEDDKNQKMDPDTQQAIKSCFDFDEEDEEEGSVIIPTALTGRKIPRVIPLTERKRSTDKETENCEKLFAVENIDNTKENDSTHEMKGNSIEEVVKDGKENEKSNKKHDQSTAECQQSAKNNETTKAGNENFDEGNSYLDKGELDSAFNELMETTSVPDLPDLNSTLKCEQNFHGSKTIKFPDKQTENKSSGNIETIEKHESTEVATKLTNPKKRFVKSFEDFEFKQNVIKQMDELNQIDQNETVSVGQSENVEMRSEGKTSPPTDFLKMKTRIMSKIIEQANIDIESKNKIMEKMESSVSNRIGDSSITSDKISSDLKEQKLDVGDDELLDKKNVSILDKATSSFKHTPRNKILETYFNESMKESSNETSSSVENKSNEETPPLVPVTTTITRHIDKKAGLLSSEIYENVPPKKKLPAIHHIDTKEELVPNEVYENVPPKKKLQAIHHADTKEELVPSELHESVLHKKKLQAVHHTDTKEKLVSSEIYENVPLKKKLSAIHHHIDTKEQLVSSDIHESVALKKKLHGRTSHPKKDKTLFENFVNSQKMQEGDIKSQSEQIEVCDVKIDLHVQNKPDVYSEIDILGFVDENIHSNTSEVSTSGTIEDLVSPKHTNSEQVDNFSLEKKDKSVGTSETEDQLLDENISEVCNKSTSFELKDNEIFPNNEEEIINENKHEENCTHEVSLVSDESTQKDPIEYFSHDNLCTAKANVKLESNKPEIKDTQKEEVIFKSEKELHEEVLETQIMESPCSIRVLLGSHKEEYVSLEKASICLPDDAICSPPRKRKPSEHCFNVETSEKKLDPLTKKMRKHLGADDSPEYNSPESYEKEAKLNDKTLEQVTKCVNQLINKVCEVESDTELEKDSGSLPIDEKQDIDSMFVSESRDLGVNSNSATETDSEEKNKLSETDAYNESLDWEKSTIETDAKDEVESNTTEKNKLDIPECKEKGVLDKCDTSDYVREEIITEEIIYFNEQDTTMENIVESNEYFFKTDSQKGTECVDKDSIVTNQLDLGESMNLEDEVFKTKEKIFSIKSTDEKQSQAFESNKNQLQDYIQNSPHNSQSDSTDFSSCIKPIISKDNENLFQDQQCSEELVTVEGNLTVVSEMDLAEGQVEITPAQIISPKRLLNVYKDDSSSITSFSDSSKDFDSVGTEFTSNIMMKEVGTTICNKKSSTYGRTELLDILEGNSDTERKSKESFVQKKSIIDDFCDFEDHIPSQIVCATRLKQDKEEIIQDIKEKGKSKKNYKIASTTSKLLERLTEHKKDPIKNEKVEIINKHASSSLSSKVPKHKSNSSKPIILSEQIIKPASNPQTTKSTKALDDIEDVEAFIIHKDPKKSKCETSGNELADQKPMVEKKSLKVSNKQPGKAKILQQTIITPSGEIIQPAATLTQTDENIFDINSMPIVLSDQILTPETIEKIPIVLSSETSTKGNTVIKEKTVVAIAGKKSVEHKNIAKLPSSVTTATVTQTSKPINVVAKNSRTPRILQTSTNRIIQRGSPLLPNTSKSGKYILVPHGSPLPSSKSVVKKVMLKKSTTPQNKNLVSNSSEIGGNKIMILTNQQGQQQRLLLTPAQQKLLGCQTQSPKVSKTLFKSNISQSNVALTKKIISTESNSGLGSKHVGQTVLLTNPSVVTSHSPNTSKIHKAERSQLSQSGNQNTKVLQTVLMKNQQSGKKMQGSDEDLEKQVAEKLEAIKASSGIKSQGKSTEIIKSSSKNVSKQSVTKKNDPKINQLESYSTKSEVVSRIFAPLNSKSPTLKETISLPKVVESKGKAMERPLNQLVIQDAVGNQTTITEGQILALPSETVDGQPQSYMLVTLDHSGNLTPLNNEALMSLDPNLGLGGDISNMVLQIEQGSLTSTTIQHNPPLVQSAVMKSNKEIVTHNNSLEQLEKQNPTKIHSMDNTEPSLFTKLKIPDVISPNQTVEQTLVSSSNTDSGQQLIISGDPVATQKFLESLTEGTTDLANLLASAEGNGIIIQTDGQQILINTDSNNQMLLSINNESPSIQGNSESNGNPIFATQLNKSQDILAAALADTDVFQPDQPSSQGKFPSQLSPNNSLYQINVGNVLETSLTLSSPIMTPLEVPSTNNKKIPDEEADILTQVPKNVDLPITITDPNISQTVANQQVASFIASELQTNLDLNLPISETAISSVSKNIHSPSYSYALSTLDESVDITQKTFSSSMPLLNDDSEQSVQIMNNVELERLHTKKYQMSPDHKSQNSKETLNAEKPDEAICRGASFLTDEDEEEKSRFTLGREMCSSLSEPPPEMFDLAEVSHSFVKTNLPSSLQSTPDPSEQAKDDEITDLSTHAESSNDGSCEIPVQPKIIAKSQNLDLLNSD